MSGGRPPDGLACQLEMMTAMRAGYERDVGRLTRRQEILRSLISCYDLVIREIGADITTLPQP